MITMMKKHDSLVLPAIKKTIRARFTYTIFLFLLIIADVEQCLKWNNDHRSKRVFYHL